MYKKQALLIIIYLLTKFQVYSQQRLVKISAGYGIAGSFLTRSIVEDAPLNYPNYKHFARMNFLGIGQNVRAEFEVNNRWSIYAGFQHQRFTRRIKFRQLSNGLDFNIDKTLHHRDYITYAGMQKHYPKKKHQFAIGLGIYYIRAKSESLEIGPNFFNNVEASYKNANANELGLVPETSYAFAFQPRVLIGIKTQFYYTISAMYAESLTCFPYVQILF